jgi:hypothetical protein
VSADLPNQQAYLEGISYGGPLWLNASYWSFNGDCFIYKAGLAVDLAISIIFVIIFTSAYEYWTRCRWHYSLRTLLCMFFVFATLMAWWRISINGWERESKAVASIQNKGFTIVVQCDAPVLLRMIVGSNHLSMFNHIVQISWEGIPNANLADEKQSGIPTFKDADFERIGDLPYLHDLMFESAEIGDESLKNINGLKSLESLHLEFTNITDVGLEYIHDLPRLQVLHLQNTKITGSGLGFFKNLPQLKYLNLKYTKVTDSLLHHIESLTNLEEINLNCTKVSSAGVKKLKNALPNCDIVWQEDPEPSPEDEQASPPESPEG